ncbi:MULTISPECIES: carboxymuconolactone decarboxylase family protein [Methanohalophilus]|jgi:AhpD family alkylhydroperoxidase|uniref:AhpD family alkylhydroperoxidase n=1 Tax=Methanohalophilus euhalobius TaxID=51203 RepID=A0A285FTX6_9EURY|nr:MULTISPECIES: carboxymuconolactone decarboxylase family protein [Methanohalophilus]KXS46400.1 MAG: alkylhydroperoxidase like protein, AhpD family [Methanohalophilus sp. T328-1]RSD34509.1 MAG: alkylhydroperoxidase like protein, AhpD family [Methanohalophilus sp.]OBZ35160.1 MAG: alkylhydroperoxidase [Methanohalophilus sp. DAL1]ODV49810.1 MAG: alkylhydroperoxidase like protein, AhpD family [Methanohalophilus sp. 2-GBenrich]PQV42439.1 AhpD family alkylhydroperoxidase [Methanohalophilus euhalobi
MKFLIDKLPETANAFADMRASLFKDSALDTKTKELIAVSSSVLMRCEKCVEIHASRARDNGATEDEIAEAVAVSMFIAGGSQLHWTRKYDQIFESVNE